MAADTPHDFQAGKADPENPQEVAPAPPGEIPRGGKLQEGEKSLPPGDSRVREPSPGSAAHGKAPGVLGELVAGLRAHATPGVEGALLRRAAHAIEELCASVATTMEERDEALEAEASVALAPEAEAVLDAEERAWRQFRALGAEGVDLAAVFGTVRAWAHAGYPRIRRSDREARALLVREVAARGGSVEGIALAAQVFGLGPCPKCGFVNDRCRCLGAP